MIFLNLDLAALDLCFITYSSRMYLEKSQILN